MAASGSSDAGRDGAPARKKRKAGRGAVACLQCRDNPEDAPAAKLKASVDRLESLVLKFRAGSSNGNPASPRSSPSASALGSPSAFSLASSQSRQSLSTKGKAVAHDAEILGRLLLGPLELGTQIATAGVDVRGMLSSLQFSDKPSTEPLPHLAEPSSVYSRPSPETFNHVLQIMPTQAQASLAIQHYFSSVDRFRILNQRRFLDKCDVFWRTGAVSDPHWLAVFLAVTGAGLLVTPDGVAEKGQMPSGEGKGLLARSWIDGALQALFSGEFLKSPSLDSIRAVVVLNQFWSTWQGGKHLQASVNFNTAVIAAAWELELHVDPDELDLEFTPFDAEDRRRLFWALFTQDTLARTFLGKTYAPLDVSTISTRLPSQLPDSAFTATGDFEFSFSPAPGPNVLLPMIALHAISTMHAKISQALGRSRRPSPAEVQALHRELEGLESAHASTLQPSGLFGESPEEPSLKLMARALLSLAHVRLSRSCYGVGTQESEQTAWHRAVCAAHCNSLLGAFDHMHGCSLATQFVVAVAVSQAAITLAVDLFNSAGSQETMEMRTRLTALAVSFETVSWPSDLTRVFSRAGIILRHVVVRIDQLKPSGVAVPAAPYFGGGHSRSASGSSSSFDASFVDTPPNFFLPVASNAQRRTSDQASLDTYISPGPSDLSFNTPFGDSFGDTFPAENGYYPNLLSGGDFGSPALPYQQPSNLKLNLFDAIPDAACPLLKPWLAHQHGASDWGFATPAAPLLQDLFA
ncbi:hypothetical protein MNV49_002651 [Pseudohyphozyma bogoriensis]|nr:hypothetical protein MNV49_002651 [Pseudohyphozyma bogoriensis]